MSEKTSSSNARPVRNCRRRSVKSLVSKSQRAKEKESQVIIKHVDILCSPQGPTAVQARLAGLCSPIC